MRSKSQGSPGGIEGFTVQYWIIVLAVTDEIDFLNVVCSGTTAE